VPQPEVAPARRSSPYGLRNWHVRSRLVLLIMIPTLTAIAFGGFRVASSVQSAASYQRVQQLAHLSSAIVTLVHPVQYRRDQTADFVAQATNGDQGALQVLYTQRQDTERAAAKVTQDLTQFGGSFSLQDRQEALAALADLENLPNLRLEATEEDQPALIT